MTTKTTAELLAELREKLELAKEPAGKFVELAEASLNGIGFLEHVRN